MPVITLYYDFNTYPLLFTHLPHHSLHRPIPHTSSTFQSSQRLRPRLDSNPHLQRRAIIPPPSFSATPGRYQRDQNLEGRRRFPPPLPFIQEFPDLVYDHRHVLRLTSALSLSPLEINAKFGFEDGSSRCLEKMKRRKEEKVERSGGLDSQERSQSRSLETGDFGSCQSRK